MASTASSEAPFADNGVSLVEARAPDTNGIKAGVMLIEGDRGIVAANLFACELLGRERDELIGHRPDEFVAWPRLAHSAPLAESGLARLVRANGSSVTVEYEVRPVLVGPVHLVLWVLHPRNATRPVPHRLGTARSGFLSPRELEILQLMADGCDNEEIAQRLVISKETVKSHVRRTLQKLNARSRTHAVAIAFRRALVD